MARANRHFLSGYVWHITHRCHKRRKVNLPQLTNEIVEKDKITQTKYHHLNMKVLDMLRAQAIDSEKINFIDNPNEIKMFGVILKFAEPYIKMYWGNEIRVRGIISLAITICERDNTTARTDRVYSGSAGKSTIGFKKFHR